MREIKLTVVSEDSDVSLKLLIKPEPDEDRRQSPIYGQLSIPEAEDLYVKLGRDIIRAKAVEAALKL